MKSFFLISIYVFLHFSCFAQKVNIYNSKNSLVTDQINIIKFDKKNNLWVGTDKGIYKYDFEKWKLFSDGLTHKSVTDLLIDSKENKWVTSYVNTGTAVNQIISGGLSLIDKDDKITDINSRLFLTPLINCVVEDYKGNIWISMGEADLGRAGETAPGGVIKYDGQNWEEFTKLDGPLKYVKAIIPREKDIIFHTKSRILCKYDYSQFKILGASNGFTDEKIWSFGMDDDNNVWTTRNNIIYKISEDKIETYDINSIAGNKFIAEKFSPNTENLYLINSKSKLAIYNIPTEKCFFSEKIKYYDDYKFMFIAGNSKSEKFIYTNKGFLSFDGNRLKNIEELNKFPFADISFYKVDPLNRFFFISDERLFLYANNTLKLLIADLSFLKSKISYYSFDQFERFIFTLDDKLYVYKNEKIKMVYANEIIRTISQNPLVDKDGKIWMATSKGLIQVEII